MTQLNDGAEVSPQRVQFDSALRVLLMRENLDGTEWAIQQLRSWAEDQSEHIGSDAMKVVADWLEGQLDKRAAELATREG
ncbi:hypothetical protein ACFRNJ_12370 [Streptomyces sp. NPDC056721]|uniref:hypothetical protein n=1 Tax=Streptomyces sp. NPDC056721 TaxID=3345923 RepID=UPI003682C4F9